MKSRHRQGEKIFQTEKSAVLDRRMGNPRSGFANGRQAVWRFWAGRKDRGEGVISGGRGKLKMKN